MSLAELLKEHVEMSVPIFNQPLTFLISNSGVNTQPCGPPEYAGTTRLILKSLRL